MNTQAADVNLRGVGLSRSDADFAAGVDVDAAVCGGGDG